MMGSRRRVWKSLLGLLVGSALAGCSSEPAEAPECACFSGPSNELQVSCEVEVSCGTIREPTDCSMTPDGQVPDGCYEDADTNNAQVVQCVLDLLASGQQGDFRYQTSIFLGTVLKRRNYLANGDGTIVEWDENYLDAAVSFSAVEAREAPDAAALEPCTAVADSFEQWQCIEELITTMPVVVECFPASDGMPGDRRP